MSNTYVCASSSIFGFMTDSIRYWVRSDNKKLLDHVRIITQIILVICNIISSLCSDNRDILDYFSDILLYAMPPLVHYMHEFYIFIIVGH